MHVNDIACTVAIHKKPLNAMNQMKDSTMTHLKPTLE